MFPATDRLQHARSEEARKVAAQTHGSVLRKALQIRRDGPIAYSIFTE